MQCFLYRGQNTEFCDLAVVTFNNSEVVEYQIRTLKKFFKYPFRYTVFDNSTKKKVYQKKYFPFVKNI